ncbi:hypothetical protein [Geitlerinema calcuttense]|uniref:Uncharacterized protein n=1 Tax=Geitlerinema calcuttense NRMC-F 0142 TaxID=2922238 RepID=A0ABT7LYH8_9CYAN|nr:hypothetical protein [Geitlerinema calcuttense]MDL5057066.1 hypothetical protein [Geitlerinema calcuttense NRMC-F 0142]
MTVRNIATLPPGLGSRGDRGVCFVARWYLRMLARSTESIFLPFLTTFVGGGTKPNTTLAAVGFR